MPLPTALPYGLRDIKITPYDDDAATILSATPLDLPNSRTLSFSEAEEFTELRGDDRLAATHGNGPQVEWELEAGGLSLEIYAAISGATLTTTGVDTAEVKSVSKKTTQSRPYFRIEGKIISDSGGHVEAVIYKAKCNENIEGEFTDGEFFLTSASGIGLGNTTIAEIAEFEDELYTLNHVATADLST